MKTPNGSSHQVSIGYFVKLHGEFQSVKSRLDLAFKRANLESEFYEISVLMAWFWFFRRAYQGKLLVVFPFHQWLQPHCRHLEFLFFWTGTCICRDQDTQNLPKSWKSHGFVAGRLHPKMEKYKNIKAHLNCSFI